MTIKINAKPVILNIVQIYAPTATAPEVEIVAFYSQLEDTISNIPSKEITLIQGDFNAKIGKIEPNINLLPHAGHFGLGSRNDSGDKLLQFCVENKLAILNTLFQHHVRRLYTWTSPGGKYRNQIDYALISTRWRSSIHNTKTYPGAECGSDHKLLVSFIKIHLKNKRVEKPKHKLNSSTLSAFKFKVQENLQELNLDLTSSTANQIWGELKTTLLTTKEEVIRNNNTVQPKKQWMSENTWKLVDARKIFRCNGLNSTKHILELRNLNKLIQKNCRRDKNEYISNICKEVERHNNSNQTRDLFCKIKEITRDFVPRTWSVEDASGNVLTEIDSILERWKNYCADLYTDQAPHRNADNTINLIETEPTILRSEVERAIDKLHNNKTPGLDDISGEMLKCLGEKGLPAITAICNSIWKTGVWPEDWASSVFIPFHKKGSTRKCSNYRTISLVSHASKIMLNILHERLKNFLEWQIPPEQAGFVKGRGTRDQILNIRQIIEKTREFNVPTYLCFLDYSKAFDCVQWSQLWRILEEMGAPKHLILLVKNLYEQGITKVKVDNRLSQNFKVCKGVRQGCILSPLLFNIYGEYVMRKSLDEWPGGVVIGGRRITNLRYADDTTVIAKNEAEMSNMLQRIENESRNLGLELNRGKTKLMVINRGNQQNNNGHVLGIEIVDSFSYLGSLISNKGGCTDEIKVRTTIAKTAMTKLQKIWKDSNISIRTKTKLVQTLVFPIALYAAESWTLKAVDKKKLDSFELWCWRRMLRIPWTARRTNLSVLEEVKAPHRLSIIVQRRILSYFGHVTRRQYDNLEKLVIQGKVEGKRPRGRSPKRWLDQMGELTGSTLQENLRNAEDRDKWRRIVHTS